MPRPTTFRDLTAWNAAVDLVVTCYRVTGSFPASETYGLISQIRRAAVSIPANVAEGNGRGSRGAYVYHVQIALGSHSELRALVEISGRLGFLSPEHLALLMPQVELVGRLLSGLCKALRRPPDPRSPIPDP